MAVYCPMVGNRITYLACLECERRAECRAGRAPALGSAGSMPSDPETKRSDVPTRAHTSAHKAGSGMYS